MPWVLLALSLSLLVAVQAASPETHSATTTDTPVATMAPPEADHSLVKVQDALHNTGLFNELTAEEFSMIAAIAELGSYTHGEYLTRKDQQGDRLFLIVLGQVAIYLEPTTPPVATLTAGSLLAEMGFIHHAPATADAVVVSESLQTIEIGYAELATLLETEPRIGYIVMRNFARDLSDKLRRSNLAR